MKFVSIQVKSILVQFYRLEKEGSKYFIASN